MVDTEDVAVKANKLAPGRFTWRKFPNQINIENVRTFLSDAKKPKNGKMLTGAGKDGWMLTAAGIQFVCKHLAKLDTAQLSKTRLTQRDQNWMRIERERMLASDAFAKFKSGGIGAITEHEAEAFFRLDSYVTGKARDEKVLRLMNVFGEDPELGPAINALETKVRRN